MGEREPPEPGPKDGEGGADHLGAGEEQEALQGARQQDGRDPRGHQVSQCNTLTFLECLASAYIEVTLENPEPEA